MWNQWKRWKQWVQNENRVKFITTIYCDDYTAVVPRGPHQDQAPGSIVMALQTVLSSAQTCNKRWIFWARFCIQLLWCKSGVTPLESMDLFWIYTCVTKAKIFQKRLVISERDPESAEHPPSGNWARFRDLRWSTQNHRSAECGSTLLVTRFL